LLIVALAFLCFKQLQTNRKSIDQYNQVVPH
jgi:hypothetical protein